MINGSDVILYIILSLTPYNSDEQQIEVSIPQESMVACERTLEGLVIQEGPEIQIFGTKLDIDAYCWSVDKFMNDFMREKEYEQRSEYQRTG